MEKIIGNKAGVQYPIVGEHDGGREVSVTTEAANTPVIEDLGRFSGLYLKEVDPYAGDDIPETGATSYPGNYAWALRGNNLVVWSANPLTFVFWVY